MCISPSNVWVERGPKWEQVPVPCKSCWRCKQNRVNDYVARSLAEAAYSETVATVNLTYAPRDDLADKVLHPRHFQLFMKLLRRAGHEVRYLVAGEYGSLKERAHFHAILFFRHLVPLEGREIKIGKDLFVPAIVPRYIDDYPDGWGQEHAPFCSEIPQERMVHIREWPHGHITVDWSADERAIRYVCKYLLADDKNSAWFSLSKKPALGAAFFAQKAAIASELGVLPRKFEYQPPGGSKDRPYLMTGASRRDYLNAITTDPDKRKRMSEWVQKTFDKHALARAKEAGDLWAKENPDEYFAVIAERWAENGRTESEIALRLAREDYDNRYIYDNVTLPMIAKDWGFDDVEEFKGFAEQKERQGEYLDGSKRPPEDTSGAVYPDDLAQFRNGSRGPRLDPA